VILKPVSESPCCQQIFFLQQPLGGAFWGKVYFFHFCFFLQICSKCLYSVYLTVFLLELTASKGQVLSLTSTSGKTPFISQQVIGIKSIPVDERKIIYILQTLYCNPDPQRRFPYYSGAFCLATATRKLTNHMLLFALSVSRTRRNLVILGLYL
jgi:hypothetical protein